MPLEKCSLSINVYRASLLKVSKSLLFTNISRGFYYAVHLCLQCTLITVRKAKMDSRDQ